MQKRAAMFLTRNNSNETGSMTGILEELKWETLQKRRKDNRLILLYKGPKGKFKPEFLQMTLSPKTGLAEINTQRHFPLLVQKVIEKQ